MKEKVEPRPRRLDTDTSPFIMEMRDLAMVRPRLGEMGRRVAKEWGRGGGTAGREVRQKREGSAMGGQELW